MTYAFRDWLDPETLSAIVDDHPDMDEWLRSRAVPDTYRDFRFRDLVRIACGMPDRAIAVPAPRSRPTGRAAIFVPSRRIRASIAIAARCVGLGVMLCCVWLIVSGAL